MFGLIQVQDEVSWTDSEGNTHDGLVLALSDCGSWADVRELDREDITVMPVSALTFPD